MFLFRKGKRKKDGRIDAPRSKFESFLTAIIPGTYAYGRLFASGPIFLNFREFNTRDPRLYIVERELSVFAGVIRYSIKSNGFKTRLSLINGHLDSIFKWAGMGGARPGALLA